MLKFTNPTVKDLLIYYCVAKNMLAEHLTQDPECPVAGITFNFSSNNVSLAYRRLTGEETVLGQHYPHNGLKTRPVNFLLNAVKKLEQEGLTIKEV